MMRLSAELLIASASLFVDCRRDVSAETIERLRREAGSSGQGAWDAALAAIFGGSKAMRVARRLLPAIGDRFLNWMALDRDAVVDTAGQPLSAIASVSDREVFG